MSRMIFVVGGKHSGTTLTATILGANDKCYLIPMETGAYSQKHIKHLRKPFVDKAKTIDSEFIVEKTPDHVFKIEKIKQDWPNESIFIVTRDPIDRVASTMRRHGNIGQSIYECANDMRACIWAMQYENTYVVTYESIVKNFNETVGSMCRFAGLEFQESMINFHENAPTWFPKHQHDDHHKKRSDQMRIPLYDDSGWGESYLTQEQIDQVMFDCGDDYERLLCRHREQLVLY
jgi:hypothetical protein